MVMEECFLERPESRFSGKARKQVFQTSEGLSAGIGTEPYRPSGGGFSDQIRSLQTEFKQALDSFNTERLNLLILYPLGKSVCSQRLSESST